MQIKPIVHDDWAVYVDGGIRESVPKVLKTKEQLEALWKTRYPESLVVVK